MTTATVEIEAVVRLSKDLRKAASTLGPQEVRFLVDAYYQLQHNRITSDNQIRSIGDDEPHALLDWLSTQNRTIENCIKSAMGVYVKSTLHGEWMISICGIGPVIGAGLLTHIDWTVDRVERIYKFAGLAPGVEWKKGHKRPWNASLKKLCYLLGESFVKNQNREKDYYGQVYADRKALEQSRNDQGVYADVAKADIKRYGKTTEAFKHVSEGRLPPAQIHARARRFAVKLFLSHAHTVGHRLEVGSYPDLPYAFSMLNHKHYILPPNLEVVGLEGDPPSLFPTDEDTQ